MNNHSTILYIIITESKLLTMLKLKEHSFLFMVVAVVEDVSKWECHQLQLQVWMLMDDREDTEKVNG